MVAVDIANLALGYLGDTATVSSLDPPEGSVQAQHCARFYPVALGMMLEAHQWNFITKRAPLALLTSSTYDPWAYAYAMPSDAADIISVLPLLEYNTADYPSGYTPSVNGWSYLSYGYGWGFGWGSWWPFPFERGFGRNFQIQAGAGGQPMVLSNIPNAVARYTSNQVQPGNFPALFTNALARLLASMLAGPLLKGDAGLKQSQAQYAIYQRDAQQAMGQDANQQQVSNEFVPSSIAARY